MSDNKKYYYLKLKENFFNKDELKLLEKQENGYIYSNLYLKLCLMSLKGEGKLLFRNEIPFEEDMISTITGVPLDNVRVGMVVLRKLGLIKIIDSGEIFLTDIQEMIGHASSEGERKKVYREKLKELKNGTMSQLCPTIRPPELELELEKELEREEKNKFIPPTLQEIIQYINQNHYNVNAKQFLDYFTVGNWIDSKGKKVKNWKQKLITWNNHNKTKQKSEPELKPYPIPQY